MTVLLDPFAGLHAFVRTADAGSFAAAARLLGTTPSAVSKSVARLERRLEVRLLQRTTRALRLTQEGEALHARAKRILADLEDAQTATGTGKAARGRLHVSAPMDFGREWLMPRLTTFLARHPAVRVELNLTDRFVDLVEEGVDVALRAGRVDDARLVKRRLGWVSEVLCASPRYLRKHGTPRTLADLGKHVGLAYLRAGKPEPWHSRRDGAPIAPDITWGFASDNNQCLRTAALAGLGILRVPRVVVERELADGTLRRVLDAFDDDGQPLQVVYPEQRLLATRVRAFIDFVVAEFAESPS